MESLHLFHNRPWDALTTAELRMVATALARASDGASYSLESVFLHLLVLVNDLDVLYANAESNDDGELEQVYWVRERKEGALPFAIPLYALQYWVKPKKEGGGGCIDWLRAGSQRTKSPEVPRCHPRFGILDGTKHRLLQKPIFRWLDRSIPRGFAAPAMLMSDVTWQHYRAITDYFEQYTKINNAVRNARLSAAALLSAQVPAASPVGISASPAPPSSSTTPSPLAGAQGDELLTKARAQWLATIFTRRILHRDRQRGTLTYSYCYQVGQATRYQHYFMRVDPVDFQMILLWWEGMQNYLARRYPKCFKRGAPKGGDKQDPLSLYSRSIATLEKFTGSDEEAINQKTYTVVLQQFNDMVEQNEEYEKLRH